MHSRRQLKDAIIHLTCILCKGYLVDATTISECLHSFCKTCIVKYLLKNNHCPLCSRLIHKTKPLQSLKLDDRLQNIVYKVVPGLHKSEMHRRRKFYSEYPSLKPSSLEDGGMDGNADLLTSRMIISADDDVSISLEHYPHLDSERTKIAENSSVVKTNGKTDGCQQSTQKIANKRYLCCPAAVSIYHIQKFVRNKFGLSADYQVDIIHSNEILDSNLTLTDVAYIYFWKRKSPLNLAFLIRFPQPEKCENRNRKVASTNNKCGEPKPSEKKSNGRVESKCDDKVGSVHRKVHGVIDSGKRAVDKGTKDESREADKPGIEPGSMGPPPEVLPKRARIEKCDNGRKPHISSAKSIRTAGTGSSVVRENVESVQKKVKVLPVVEKSSIVVKLSQKQRMKEASDSLQKICERLQIKTASATSDSSVKKPSAPPSATSSPTKAVPVEKPGSVSSSVKEPTVDKPPVDSAKSSNDADKNKDGGSVTSQKPSEPLVVNTNCADDGVAAKKNSFSDSGRGSDVSVDSDSSLVSPPISADSPPMLHIVTSPVPEDDRRPSKPKEANGADNKKKKAAEKQHKHDDVGALDLTTRTPVRCDVIKDSKKRQNQKHRGSIYTVSLTNGSSDSSKMPLAFTHSAAASIPCPNKPLVVKITRKPLPGANPHPYIPNTPVFYSRRTPNMLEIPHVPVCYNQDSNRSGHNGHHKFKALK